MSDIFPIKPNIITASSICESIFDGTHDSPKQHNHGFKLVTSKHIKANKVLSDEAYYINEEDYLKINKRSGLQNGDVLFTMIGTVGEVCRLTFEPDFAIKNIGVFRPSTKSDSLWIYYYLLSPEGRKSIEAAKRGTTQQFIGLKELREFPLNFPGDSQYRANQLKILELLDFKIAANIALSKTLEDIVQNIFKSWFIDFDPVKAKMAGDSPVGMDDATAALFPDSLVESELGLIPKDWKVAGLSDFAKQRKEVAKLSSIDAETRYVGLEHLPRKSLFFRTWSTADQVQSSKSFFERNDILFGKLRPYFHKVVVSPIDGVCSTDIVVIKSLDERVDPFTASLVNQSEFIAFVTNRSSGTRMPRTSWQEMCEFKIAFPGSEIMQKFNKLMEPFFLKAMTLSSESNAYEIIRDSLLPRLISGELEIPEEILSSQ